MECPLDENFRRLVDIGRGLVEDRDPRVADDGPGEAQQLKRK